MKVLMVWVRLGLLVAVFSWGGISRADFVLIESFEDLLAGPIQGQGTWFATTESGTVTADPEAGDNQVLAVITNSAILRRDLTLSKGTTRMLFFRLYFTEQQSYSVGLSHLTYPSEFSDFGPELSMTNARTDLRVNNDGMYDLLVEDLPGGRWYHVWVLVNHHDGTSQIWLHDRGLTGATAGDKLSNSVNEEIFDFRINPSGDFRRFYIKTGGGSSNVNLGPFYIDDIYLENSPAVNLNHPLVSVSGEMCVDLVDFARLTHYWLEQDCNEGNAWCDFTDRNESTTVDAVDLVLLSDEWLQHCEE